jgi:hypothetical protein
LLHLAKEQIDLLSSRDVALARAYDKRGQLMAFTSD